MNREKNSKLVPELLNTLREHQDSAERERLGGPGDQDRFKRPFALFSKSPVKLPRRLSSDCEMEGVTKLGSGAAVR